MLEGIIDPSWMITKLLSFDDKAEAYKDFDENKEGYLKLLLVVWGKERFFFNYLR